jgi:hypothetical protein
MTMKKLILTIIAALSISSTTLAENVSRYDLDFDMRRLASRLELTETQMESFQIVQDNFNNAIHSAGDEVWFKRRHIVRKAVMEDARNMQKILSPDQFRTYMLLLMTTLRNRRI